MTDGAFRESGAAVDAGFAPMQTLRLEVVLDRHSLTGDVRYPGAPKRLVDILNSMQAGGYLVLRDGEIADPARPGAPARSFTIAQIHPEAVLFATAETDVRSAPDSFEFVQKVPVRTTVLLPGYEITGNAFLVPGLDPATVPFLGNRQFMPFVDATIRCRGADVPERQERLVAVNVTRALLYAPLNAAR